MDVVLAESFTVYRVDEKDREFIGADGNDIVWMRSVFFVRSLLT